MTTAGDSGNSGKAPRLAPPRSIMPCSALDGSRLDGKGCGGRWHFCAIGAIGSSMSCRCSGTVQIGSAKAFSGRLSDQAASDRRSKLGSAAWLDGMARRAPG